LNSTICGDGLGHFTVHVVAAFIELGLRDDHVETLQLASYEPQSLVCNILTRNPEHETRNTSIAGVISINYRTIFYLTNPGVFNPHTVST